MSLSSALETLKAKIGNADNLSKVVKIDLGDDGVIVADGTQSPTAFSTEDADADVTLSMSLADFENMLAGDLNPQMAFMTGKLKVTGDMALAMQLGQLLE
ncbi:MAG: sterol-binding protein [Alphaproteobacteria bacterium]|nr:MAG: sterol-binding protein [Alphaproteobacteria bacterium]